MSHPPKIKEETLLPPGISHSEAAHYAKVDYPLFSFKYLQNASLKGCNDAEFLSTFLFRLKKLSELGWKEIWTSGRHSFGMEKIAYNCIKPQIPAIKELTEDVKLISFRAAGDKRPFVGFCVGKVFYILFVETDFGDIYDH